jgi:glycosyltransferase involved in cell wall biosynthesis
MNKKITVTISIPAYNEQVNIGTLLDLLIKQKQKNISLEKIVVYTDGSKDRTPIIVQEKMKTYPLIQLIKGKDQKGKFYRLNKIFRDNSSDVLIVLDADIGINSNMFVDNFAMSVMKDDRAQMISAHELPIIPKDFIGRVIAASYVTWDYIRWSIPNCDHVQNAYMRATAYRGSFAKTLHIPEKATEERLYLYLMAKKTNGYRYARNAQITYWPVNTIHDYILLSDRAFGRPQPAVNKIVGYDATYLYSIPTKYKRRGILKAFIKDPVFTLFGMILGFILNKMTLSRKTKDSAIWKISLSSKKKI